MNRYSDLVTSDPGSLSSGITGLLQGRLAGNDPGLRAKFREADDAYGRAAATARANSMQTLARSGTLSAPAIRRNLQTTDQQILSGLSTNKLEQEQAQAKDQNEALGMAMPYQMQNLQLLGENAQNSGDAGAIAALSGIYMGQSGYSPTDRLDSVRKASARDAAATARWAHGATGETDVQGPWWKRGLKGVIEGGMAGAATGNPLLAAGGAGAGGLSSIYL